MQKEVTLGSYLFSKCVIGNGIINGLINALIFYFTHLGSQRDYTVVDVALDLGITLFILAPIVLYIALPLVNSEKKKGHVPKLPFDKQKHAVAKILPKRKHALIWFSILLAALGTLALFVLISLLLGPLSVIGYTVLKGIACGTCGAIASYLFIIGYLE